MIVTLRGIDLWWLCTKSLFRSRTKIVLLLLATAIFYNEFLSYSFEAWIKWPSVVACDTCIKILLVADPQIIGEKYETLGAIARWDCDRYLSKTFHRAIAHVNPDVVVFLGDIMDEGSIASNEEYLRYLHRFKYIFSVAPNIKMLYLPGDNDIGGEDDQITAEKLRRYEHSFHQDSTLTVKHIDMFKINRLTYSIPPVPDNHTLFKGNRTRIILTHLPLLFLQNQFVHKVMKLLRPQVIFSAHDHKSLHTSVDLNLADNDQILEMLNPSDGAWWNFPLGRNIIHEVMVPTCSYRMGVPDMGFGVAIFDSTSQHFSYTVLWLPSRFKQLGIYVGVLVVTCFYVIISATLQLRRCCCCTVAKNFV